MLYNTYVEFQNMQSAFKESLDSSQMDVIKLPVINHQSDKSI